ncbi:MAG: contractile injection system tape measure protein [Bacteroidetes bacterium]|nr:contractile injection system tape measure protein [Bacteroidota bacterium]
MGEHIIHKQKVQIKLSRAVDSFAIQNRVSRVLRDELPQILETLFDKISPNGKSLRIDKLILDLGIISEQNLEKEFKEKVLEQLSKVLVHAEEIAMAMESPEISGVSEVSKEQSLVEALIYYLENGYPPWYSTVKDFRVWENSMLQSFTGEEWKKLILALKRKITISDTPVRRLTLQFSETFLQTCWLRIHETLLRNWNTISDDLMYILQDVKAGMEIMTPGSQSRFYLSAITAALLANNDEELIFEFMVSILLKWDLFRVQNEGLIPPTPEKITPLPSSLRKKLLLRIQIIEGKISSEEILNVLKRLHQSIDGSSSIRVDQKKHVDRKEDKKDERNGSLPEEDKKVEKKQPLPEENGIFCENSGIVILHPFLQLFYTELGFFDGHFFKDEWSQHRAIFLLHYLATGETSAIETRLLLPKLLCATDFDEPLPFESDLTESEKESCETLLRSVLSHWEPLRTTSIGGLQQTFLQREGKLVKTETGWKLHVEQKTVDILLDKLPWGFSTIRLPWMEQILNVDWC